MVHQLLRRPSGTGSTPLANGISTITRLTTVSTRIWKNMPGTEASWILGVVRATQPMNYTSSAYGSYLGLDISDIALDKARRRSEANGRSWKNRFLRADFLKYAPKQRFDVILFRESLYHVPLRSVKPTFDRYSEHLIEGGVFIVRIATKENGKDKSRPMAMLRVIESGFDILKRVNMGTRWLRWLFFGQGLQLKA